MFHYSIKEHVSYAPKKKKSYPVNFVECYITRHLIFVHTAQLMTYPMHWDVSEIILNKLVKQLPINIKSLRGLLLALG